ncbi:hypothetical protein [Bradyrhizobium sp. LMG 9283]
MSWPRVKQGTFIFDNFLVNRKMDNLTQCCKNKIRGWSDDGDRTVF